MDVIMKAIHEGLDERKREKEEEADKEAAAAKAKVDSDGEAKEESSNPGKRTRKATSPEGIAVEAEPEAKSEE
jgi:small subunit ribosomal protein S2